MTLKTPNSPAPYFAARHGAAVIARPTKLRTRYCPETIADHPLFWTQVDLERGKLREAAEACAIRYAERDVSQDAERNARPQAAP